MKHHYDRLFFLSDCIARVMRLTGHAASTCRQFVSDFEPLLFEIDQGEANASRAVRMAGVAIASGGRHGQETGLRRGQACQIAQAIAWDICARVAAGDCSGNAALKHRATQAIQDAQVAA